MNSDKSAQPVNVILREKPVPPGDYECCESGCSPCVWDTYYEDLNTWNAEQKALKEALEQAADTEQRT
ncbi:oxidoreductase-like domain-containing protein [Amphritea sp.]|uniref:oxidoreductase-like domain-containing protein n=1 Tax=Amphritea sp. TaxID=1872502 RepID=UPI003D12FAB1